MAGQSSVHVRKATLSFVKALVIQNLLPIDDPVVLKVYSEGCRDLSFPFGKWRYTQCRVWSLNTVKSKKRFLVFFSILTTIDSDHNDE